MSDEIKNLGTKARGFAWFFVYFILFILLLIYIYKYNSGFLPVQ